MAHELQKATVSQFDCLSEYCSVFRVRLKTEKPLLFKAGQFITILVPNGVDARPIKRSYSIASAPQEDQVELCVKLVDGGPGSTFLNQLRPRDSISYIGPFGHFVTRDTSVERPICFIATGTGVAPFRSMWRTPELSARATQKNAAPLHLLFGLRDELEIFYKDEILENKILNSVWAFSRLKNKPLERAFLGRVTDYLRSEESHSINRATTHFYLCGNGAMIDEVKTILASQGVAKESIFQEIYYRPSENT